MDNTEQKNSNDMKTKKYAKAWAVPLVKKVTGGFIETTAQASVILVTISLVLITLSVQNFAISYNIMRRIHPSQAEIQKLEQAMAAQAKITTIHQAPAPVQAKPTTPVKKP